MKVWHLTILVIVVLAALILLILNSYADPTLEEARPLNDPGSTAENRSVLEMNPVNGRPPNILLFCSDPWPPYAGHSRESRQGYIVDVLREIYEPLGYDVRYVNKPWSRCISETRTGQLSALAGADVDEVPDFVFPQETIGLTRPAFFVLSKTVWTYQGVDSLADIKLGMIQDYTYEAKLDEYIRQNLGTDRVLAAKGNDALIRLLVALQAGRIDALVENAPVVYYTARQQNLEPALLQEAGAPKQGVRLYVPFSPARPESATYAHIFDQGIRELRQSGRLQEILTSYGLQDWSDQALETQQHWKVF